MINDPPYQLVSRISEPSAVVRQKCFTKLCNVRTPMKCGNCNLFQVGFMMETFVSLSLCIHMHMHAYIHTWCVHTYLHACIHTYIHTCMHACMHPCMCIDSCFMKQMVYMQVGWHSNPCVFVVCLFVVHVSFCCNMHVFISMSLSTLFPHIQTFW